MDLEALNLHATPTLGAVSPLLIVTRLRRSIVFYCTRLGFEVRYATPQDEPFFAIVGRGQAQLMLKDPRVDASETIQAAPNVTRHANAPWDAFVATLDPDALAAELTNRDMTLSSPLEARTDGLIGFAVKDPDGYVLFFGRPA